MKKLHAFFSILFLLPVFCLSQNYWEHITTNDTSGVWSVAVANDGTIYYGGEKGFFISHDDGLSWDYKYLLSYLTAFDIKFDTDSNLIIAAGHDKICKYFIQEDSSVYLPISGNSDIRLILLDSNYIFTNYGKHTILRYSRENNEWQIFNLSDSAGYIHALIKDQNGILYAGTSTFTYYGGGIYKSVDSGETWEYFGLKNYNIESIVIDSYNRLYAGATKNITINEGGFFRYNDEQQEWDTLYHNPRVQCLYVNDEDSLFAGLYKIGGTGGAWMSPDYGDTWIKISSGLVTSSINVYEIVGGPNSYLYSVVGEHQALYKTTDSTITHKNNYFINQEKVELFPNPFSEHINIKLIDGDKTDATFHLYNILGIEQKIRMEKEDFGQYKIYVSELSEKGFYIIMIQSGERTYIQKVIKY